LRWTETEFKMRAKRDPAKLALAARRSQRFMLHVAPMK
jgi:hypothetical protein